MRTTISIDDDIYSIARHLAALRQISDAFLLLRAAAHAGKLVTFDGGIAALAPPRYMDSLVVVMVG